MTDYGTDLAAVFDSSDPEVLASGEQNAAYAIARRWLTPSGALADVGETGEYDSIDLYEWLGKRVLVASDLDDLKTQAEQVALEDPRVLSIVVTPSFNNGVLTVTAQAIGTQGPFTLVVAIGNLTEPLIQVT